jgi:receptor protein-tyrosine kinase
MTDTKAGMGGAPKKDTPPIVVSDVAARVASGGTTNPNSGATPASPSGSTPIANRAMSLGDILVANGYLQRADLNGILELQKNKGLPFGEAAMALNLLRKSDLDFALSKQFDYAYLSEEDESLSPQLVAAYQPFSSIGENLRALRSQLMLRWFTGQPQHRIMTVVSAAQGDGRSFLAANLAIVFAQQGQRTLLIDGDLRAKPESGQQALFQLDRSSGLSGILAGRGGMEQCKAVPSLPGLGVLPAGAVPPNPQELLGRAIFGKLLAKAAHTFDVVLIDTPSGSDYADAEIISARAGAAMMVARKNQSLLQQTTSFANRLQMSGVTLVGSVLNDA